MHVYRSIRIAVEAALGAAVVMVLLLASCHIPAARAKQAKAIAAPLVNDTHAPDIGRLLDQTDQSSYMNCSGWPEPRRYFEGQHWFTEAGSNVTTDGHHIVVAACLPWNQAVTGMITLDVLVEFHNVSYDKYMLSHIMAVVLDEDDTTQEWYMSKNFFNWTCAGGARFCRNVFRITANTMKFPFDGMTMFKVKAVARRMVLDNSTQYNADHDFLMWPYVSAPVRFNNSRSLGMYPKRMESAFPIRSLAWLSFPWAYLRSILDSGLPVDGSPVCGTWHLAARTEQMPFVLRAGRVLGTPAPGVAVTRSLICIDPDFHNFYGAGQTQGLVVLEADGAWNGTLAIDTTRLANGVHRMFIRTDSYIAPGSFFPQRVDVHGDLVPNEVFSSTDHPFFGGTMSSVLVIPFSVQN